MSIKAEDATASQDAATTDGVNASGFPDPSPTEAMFFFNMIKNMNNQPDIDWDGVATDSGFKNAAVAKKRFYQIKQKLGLDSRTNTAVVKTPRKPTTKPRKIKVAAEAPATPSPSPSPDAGDVDNDDDAEAATPPKPAPKRRKTNTGKAIKVGAVKAETETIKAEELSEANVKKLRTPDKTTTKQAKNGRTPLPTGSSRVQQRTPSESGGEDKSQADGEDKDLANGEEEVHDSITVAVLPSVEVKAEGAIGGAA